MMNPISKYYLYNREILPGSEPENSYLASGINIYEVFRVIDFVPLFLEDHIDRLKQSLQKCQICSNIHGEQLMDDIRELIRKNNFREGNIKIIIHVNEENREQFITAFPIAHNYPTEEKYKEGVHTTLLRAERDKPNIKNWRGDFRKKVAELKSAKNVYEVILINKDGIITEGSQSNIFIIKDDTVYTAPGNMVLKGITRKYILKICKDLQIKIVEKTFGINELKSSDVIFLTGTSPKVLPVKALDEVTFNIKNNIFSIIQDAYDNIIYNYVKTNRNEI